jgi:PAS domain S-box-containing protein
VGKNVTNRVEASEKFFRSIFENAQIGISFLNIDGSTVFSNRALHEMLGYSEEELSQFEKWDEIIHPDERTSGAERYVELVQGKRDNDEWEQRFVRKDGSIMVANGRFSLLRDGTGKPQYVASFTEDITESKRAQEGRCWNPPAKAFSASIWKESARSSIGPPVNCSATVPKNSSGGKRMM